MEGAFDQTSIDMGVSLYMDVTEDNNTQIERDPYFEEEFQQDQNVQAICVYSTATNTDDLAMDEYKQLNSDPPPLSTADEEIVERSHESCQKMMLKDNNTRAPDNSHNMCTVQENKTDATRHTCRSNCRTYRYKWYDDHTYAMVIGGSSRRNKKHHHKQYQEFQELLKTGSNCCVICHMECEDSTSFQRHVTLHSTYQPLQCVECEKICYSQHTLRHHMKIHSLRYKPPVILPVTYPRKSLTPSRKSCKKVRSIDHSEPNKYLCDRCGKTFNKQNLFKYHKLRQICIRDQVRVPALLKIYTCEVCGHSMASKDLLKRHMYRHTGQSPYSCSTCGKAFPTRQELQDHATIHSEARPFQCQSCGKCFKIKNSMVRHMKVHILENPLSAYRDKLFACAYCEKPFTTRKSLKRHELLLHTMTNVRPFHCEICGKGFKAPYDLTKHKRRHTKVKKNTANKPRPYCCEFCSSTFSKQRYLNSHQMSHTHGHALYNCDECDACFTYSVGLTGHKKIHSDNKPFECNICGLRFHRRSVLKVHLVTHSGDHPFKCETCGKGFNRERVLRTHKKMHLDDVNNITA